jgi:hypothetical protein
VASSDATNITSAITRSSSGSGSGSSCCSGGGRYVVQGLKWWTSGAMDPRCKVGGMPSCTRDVLLLYCKFVLLMYCRFTVVDERSHGPSL